MRAPREQEKARRIATSIVSVAIAVVGVTLALFAVLLVLRGGWGFLFVALLLLAAGVVLALLGLFFNLVPMRLDELAEAKRERDRRE